MTRLLYLLGPVLLGSGVAQAQGGNDGLPIVDVVDAARNNAPSIQVAKTDLEVAEHSVGSAVSLHLPRVSLSDKQTYRYNNPEKYAYSYDYESGGECVDPSGTACLPVVVIDGMVTLPDNMWSNSVSLTGVQPVLAPRQVVAVKQAVERVESAELQVKGKQEQLVLDLLSTYFELQASMGEEAAYEQSLKLTEELADNLLVRFDTGQSTSLDLERALLDVEEAEVKLRQLKDGRPLTATELSLKAGASAEETFQVCSPKPAIDPGRYLPLESSTRLMMLEQQVQMDRLSLQAARTSALPTLNVVGGLSFSGNGDSMEAVVEDFMFDNWFLGGSLSISLFEGGGRLHSNRSKQLSLKSSQDTLTQKRQETNLADLQLAQQLSDITEDIELMDRSIILSIANVEAIRTRYLAGMATFEMWTYARQSLEALKLRRVAAVQQQWQLTAYRWISVGQVDDLLQWVASMDEAADAKSCLTVSAAPVEERP